LGGNEDPYEAEVITRIALKGVTISGIEGGRVKLELVDEGAGGGIGLKYPLNDKRHSNNDLFDQQALLSAVMFSLKEDLRAAGIAAWEKKRKEGVAKDRELKKLREAQLKERRAQYQDASQQGGIDFARSNLNLQIKRDGSGMPLPVSQQNLDGIQINGLVPVILDIQPATTLPLFTELQAEAQAASV
jgi:hypothetical protein